MFWKAKDQNQDAKVKPQEEDIDFVEESKRAILKESPLWTNSLLYGVVLFIAIALLWSKNAVLDEITIASGKVIPSSQVQVIQNLEGGILSEILVAEGKNVTKGQILLRIDDTRFSASYREQYSKYLSLLASIARLRAETTGEDNIVFPKVVIKDDPDLIVREKQLFNTKVNQLESNLRTLQQSYELAKKEIDITKPLVDEGLMSQLELLRIEREVNDLRGEISSTIDKFKSESHEELTKKEIELGALTELISAMKDRVVRTVVRSPVDGTVKKINIRTIGGVIKPGMDIMEIVPTEDTLLIEAKVKPSDIAFIHPGQAAIVKVTAYNFAKYGGLDGVVEYISVDTIQEENDNEEESYYKILVRTDRSFLGTTDVPLHIIPGMIVTADILTGKKSVFNYLITPFTQVRERALTER